MAERLTEQLPEGVLHKIAYEADANPKQLARALERARETSVTEKLQRHLGTESMLVSTELRQPRAEKWFNIANRMLGTTLLPHGAHRTLEEHIEIHMPNPASSEWVERGGCNATVVELLPPQLYAKQFECSALSKKQALNRTMVYGDQSNERIAFQSGPSVIGQRVQGVMPSTAVKWGRTKVTLDASFPLHARYPNPSSWGRGMTNVKIGYPVLIAKCPGDRHARIVPCTNCTRAASTWSLPHGSLLDCPTVLSATAISRLLAALAIAFAALFCRAWKRQ